MSDYYDLARPESWPSKPIDTAVAAQRIDLAEYSASLPAPEGIIDETPPISETVTGSLFEWATFSAMGTVMLGTYHHVAEAISDGNELEATSALAIGTLAVGGVLAASKSIQSKLPFLKDHS